MFFRGCRFQFRPPAGNSLLKLQNCLAESPKLIKNHSFFNESVFFFKIFLPVRRKPFWQPCQKTSAKSNISPYWKWWLIDKTAFFSQRIFSKISSGHKGSRYEYPTENIWHEVRKWWKNILKKFSYTIRSSGHAEFSFDNPAEKFRQWAEWFLLEVEKDKMYCKFLKKLHFLKTFLSACRLLFWQPCPKYPAKIPKFVLLKVWEW